MGRYGEMWGEMGDGLLVEGELVDARDGLELDLRGGLAQEALVLRGLVHVLHARRDELHARLLGAGAS